MISVIFFLLPSLLPFILPDKLRYPQKFIKKGDPYEDLLVTDSISERIIQTEL